MAVWRAPPAGSDRRLAVSWLATLQLSSGPAERAGAPPLVIGTWGSVEQELVAGIVAEQLHRRGQVTHVVEPLPTRHAALEALAGGEVQVVPEYTASLLEHLNGAAFEASADPALDDRPAGGLPAQFGVLVTRPSPASITAAFLVRTRPARRARPCSGSATCARWPSTSPPHPPIGGSAGRGRPGSPCRCVCHAWRRSGGRGYEVLAVQHRLGQLGFAVSPTGTFDQITLGALQAFQTRGVCPPPSHVDRDHAAVARSRLAARQPAARGAGRVPHVRRRSRSSLHAGDPRPARRLPGQGDVLRRWV